MVLVGVVFGYFILLGLALSWELKGRTRQDGPLKRFSRPWWVYCAPLRALLGLVALAAALIAAGFAALGGFILSELLKEFYWALALFVVAWGYARLQSGPRWRIVADALFPLVVGMGLLFVMVESARLFVPAADWPWLFRIQEAAGWTQRKLAYLSPKDAIAQVAILVGFFAVSVALPWAARWLPSVQKGLKLARATAAILTAFTSFSFCGSTQAGNLVQFTKRETQDRVMPDAKALAEMSIATKIKQDPDAEAAVLRGYFSVVEAGVRTELEARRATSLRQEDPSPEEVKDLVKTRAQKIREEVAKAPVVTVSGAQVSQALTLAVGRPLTDEERAGAHKAFEDSINVLVQHLASGAGQPLTEWLKTKGVPEVAVEIAKALYTQQVKTIAASITEPVADAWFRPGAPQGRSARIRLAALPAPPAFDEAVLPRPVARPTVGERVKGLRAEALEHLRAQLADTAHPRRPGEEGPPVRPAFHR